MPEFYGGEFASCHILLQNKYFVISSESNGDSDEIPQHMFY